MRVYSSMGENLFDKCTMLTPRTVECINFLGDRERHIIEGADHLALCTYHYCMPKLQNFNKTRTLTCSGAVFMFDDEYYFNPLTFFKPIFSRMRSVPEVLYDFIPSYKLFYVKDVRTVFSAPIERVYCTNTMRTCVLLEGQEESVCFGNDDGAIILNTSLSFVLGVSLACASGGMIYFVLHKYIVEFNLFYLYSMYILTLLGNGFIVSGLMMVHHGFLALGMTMVLLLEPQFRATGAFIVSFHKEARRVLTQRQWVL